MDAKELLDSLDVGVAAVAPDWTIAEWSAGAARVTGVAASQAQGRNFWIAFSAAQGGEIEEVLRRVLADGKARTCLMPAHASEVPGTVLETRVTRAPHNHLVMAFRQMQEALPPESRASQLLSAFEIERRLYLQLFNSLPTPGLVLTADGQILDANPEGATLLGVPDAPAVRGRSLTEWAAEPQRTGLVAALRGYLEAVRADPATWRLVLMPPEGAPAVLREHITRGRTAVVGHLAETIRHLMFVFEDLLLIDPLGLKEVLAKVDRKVLTVALKGTSEQLRNHMLSCMSQRGADMLREDMEALGPVKIKEVEQSQQQIIAIVRQLESEGVLSLKGAVGEQYVV